jgi:hypothetical protein
MPCLGVNARIHRARSSEITGVAAVGDDEHVQSRHGLDIAGDVVGADPLQVVVRLGIDRQPIGFVGIGIMDAVAGESR